MIIGRAVEQVDLAVIESLGEVDGELVAFLGIEPGFTDTFGGAHIAADHVVEVVAQLAADHAVHPLQAEIGGGVLKHAFGIRAALFQNEVGGQTDLTVGVNRVGTAAQAFHALDGFIHAEDRGVFQKGEGGRWVNGQAVDGNGDKVGITATRETANENVCPGYTAGALNPDAGDRFQQVGGTGRGFALDVFGTDGGNGKAGVQLAHGGTPGRTGDHHFFNGAHGGLLLGFLGLGRNGQRQRGH